MYAFYCRRKTHLCKDVNKRPWERFPKGVFVTWLVQGCFRFLFRIFFGEVALRFCDDYTGEGDKGNEVRDGHEAVDDIGKNPDSLKFEEGTGCNQHNKNQAIRQDALGTHEVDAGAFAIVVPAENRREGEECQGNRQELTAEEAIDAGEGCAGHSGAGSIALPYAGQYECQSGHRADDDGIDERTCHRDEALFRRVFGLGGSCGNRCRTEAGLIGEYAAGDTVLHGHHDGGASKTAGGSRAGKGTFQNQRDSSRDSIEVHEDKAKADGDV